MRKEEWLRRTGDPAQLAGIRDFTFNGGKAGGLRALELYNAAGLSLTVLPDRGMDIARLSYKGVNLSFLSKTGLTAPQYFTEDGSRGFFRNFFAGFLTTCGLTYMGAACTDGGEVLGLHGLISNTPADAVSAQTDFGPDGMTITAKGRVKQAQVFGEHLVLQRNITLAGEKNIIQIHDSIENLDFEPVPFMLLYHINFGYPMLSPACELRLPSRSVTPRDDAAKSGFSERYTITKPVDGAKEQVFFHIMQPDENGKVHAMLVNHDLQIAVELCYPIAQLPHFTQWKCMKSGEYVLGLEPGNCHVLGRAAARADSSLQYLQPGQRQEVRIEIKIYNVGEKIDTAGAAHGMAAKGK